MQSSTMDHLDVIVRASNGQVLIQCTYCDGLMNGLYEEWYESGQKRLECTFANGMLVGLHTAWDETGYMYFQTVY